MENLDTLMAMMEERSIILTVAETVCRLGTLMHNAGRSADFYESGCARNIFGAAVVITARTVGCTIKDARIAAALHLGLAGWTTPHSEELAEVIARIRKDGCAAFAPYELIWTPIPMNTVPRDMRATAKDGSFATIITDLITRFADSGINIVELATPEMLGVKYSTLNAWKGGHRIPNAEKQQAVLQRAEELLNSNP